MRVTNTMVSNTMLLNINRNLKYVNKLANQIATTKKISKPSDDPIIASRALKFRTNVEENLQFQRNVSQADAWMKVTEGAYNNVVDIMKSIKELSVQASTGTLEAADKEKIVASLKQLTQQIGKEMNANYGGRYVFSGFRTDQPPTFERDNQASYNITQTFDPSNIEKTLSYQKPTTNAVPPASTWGEPKINNINVIRLPYKEVTGLTNANAVQGQNTPPTNYTVRELSIDPKAANYSADAYNVSGLAANEMIYIKETGELIMNDATAQKVQADGGLNLNYTKTGFTQGELNPQVYFKCTQTADENGVAVVPAKNYTMDNQMVNYEFSTNTRIDVNSLAKDSFTDNMYADLMSIVKIMEQGKLSTEKELREYYSTTAIPNLSGEQLEKAITDQMNKEKGQLQSVLGDRFNNALKFVETYSANLSKERADLGSRMTRLDLIQKRLEMDEETYKELMSDNEDVDMMQAMMDKNNAESAYTAALKIGASIMQLSLANFI